MHSSFQSFASKILYKEVKKIVFEAFTFNFVFQWEEGEI